MGEKIMYTYMCNWVTMLYSRKEKNNGEITVKKLKIRNEILLYSTGNYI